MILTKYLIKRLFWSIFVLIGLSIVIFSIAFIVPGDPARMSLGPHASAEQVAALREQMGLNQPLITQYFSYMGKLIQGDMGSSLLTGRAVNQDVASTFPATLELVLATTLVIVMIAVPLGVLSAYYKDRVIDNVGRLFALIGVVTPAFLIAILLQFFASFILPDLKIPFIGTIDLPISGRISSEFDFSANVTGFMLLDSLIAGRLDIFYDAIKHLILPVLALSAASIGQITRIMRSSMIDVARKDYVEAERAFGIPEHVILFKYMLKPSSIPTMTILGLEMAALMGNAFIIEIIFSWPGMASYGVRTIMQKDFNAVMGVVIISGLFFLIANLIVDILVSILDPRIRIKEQN